MARYREQSGSGIGTMLLAFVSGVALGMLVGKRSDQETIGMTEEGGAKQVERAVEGTEAAGGGDQFYESNQYT